MKTILTIPSMKIFGLLLGAFAVSAGLCAAHAAIVYDSGGFESFLPGQTLDGQAAALSTDLWAQDNGTSSAQVSAVNPVEGNQSVRIGRAAGATANTRWGVMKTVTPTGLNNVVNVYFDMLVERQPNDFGPAFGLEAYDAGLGTPKLIGSLLVEAGSRQILCQSSNNGALVQTGTYPDLTIHHHYRLSLNFTAHTYSLYVDGDFVHTEGFVDPTATKFTDAPFVTLTINTNNDAGIAYVDNYRIEQTTSQLPYLLWKGDGATNRWDVGVSSNWFDGIGTVTFANGSDVLLDDTGSAVPAMNLQGNLLPGTITISATQDYQFTGSGSINGAASIVKKGAGTFTIFNTNSYTGETEILEGNLAIRNVAGVATGTNKVSVFPRCTVSGNGTIGGSLWVAKGGIVAPGVNGAGTLTISNQLVLDESVLRFDLGATSDRLVAGGDLTLGGTLEITNAAGFGPGTYTLITYGGALTAGTLLVTAAPAGYDYTVSTNTPGEIHLVVTPPPTPPDAPSHLVATAAGASEIDLTWTDNSTNETSFHIERSEDNVTFVEAGTAAANAPGYADTGLSSGVTYYYRVRAGNAGGDSPYSNVAQATTDASEAVAWYEFEGNTLDSSGNNHPAVPTGVFTYEKGTRGSQAAVFDGHTFATVTKIVETNFTVAAWVKTTNTGVLPVLDAESPGTSADWGTLISGGKWGMFVGAPDTFVYSSLNVNDGAWHYLAITRRSDTGEARVYVDGVLNKVATLPTGPRTASIDFHIGANHAPLSLTFFTGSMDDMRIYDRVLNPLEILSLSKLPFAQWQLDNFGCTNCPQAAADADPDGDGISNSAEFDAGTSPTNSLSGFKILNFAVQTNNAAILWRAVGGHTNVVQAVVGDSGGGITPNFIDVSGPIVIGGTGDTTTNFTDMGAADGTARYYRVRQAK